MKTLLLSSLLLSVSFSAAAGDLASGKNAKSKAPSFKTIDKNVDGSISAQEAQVLPQLQAMFAEFDKDNNKKISKDEYAQFVKEIK